MAEAPHYAERLGARLPRGTVLGERYRLESILGAGAFGVVWQARHVHLDTECALKLFDPPPGADPEDTGARFLQEARLTARLKCPYVARVFDYGVHERMPFLVLELLRGMSLGSHLDALRARGLRLPAAETARVIRHVAEALQVAHAARVVHRDLKPENIFLVPEGENYTAKVLDFGIAKWSTDASPSLTSTGVVMGTAHYMSPEQFESARQVDHRADLWSLGVIAFECLTGQVPFPGETFIDVAFKVCKEGPLVASALAAVPPGFDAWFARATALGREYRFDSAIEQARALEQVCAAELAPAHGPASRVPEQPEAAASASAAAGSTTAPPAVLLARTLGSQRRHWRNAARGVGALLLGVGVWQVLTPESAAPAPETLPSQGAVAAAIPLRDTSPAAALGLEPVNNSVKFAAPTILPAPVAVPAAEPASAAPLSNLGGASKVKQPPAPKPPIEKALNRPPATAAKAEPAPKPRTALAPPSTAQPAPAPKPAAPLIEPRAEAKPEAPPLAPPVEPSSASTAVMEAAALALARAAKLAEACHPQGGPAGPGKVRVIYSLDGEVKSVEILTAKFRETLTGSCVRMVFRRAKIAPFKGEPPTFIKGFTIREG